MRRGGSHVDTVTKGSGMCRPGGDVGEAIGGRLGAGTGAIATKPSGRRRARPAACKCSSPYATDECNTLVLGISITTLSVGDLW